MLEMLPKKGLLASAVATLAVGTACFLAVMHMTSGYLFRNDGAGYFILTQSMVLDLDTEVLDDYLEFDARVPPDSPAMSGLRTRREPNPERVIFPWPIGSGLVMVPFYAVGYGLEWLIARASGRSPEADGLLPQLFFGYGSLFYGWLGYWASFLCCRRFLGASGAAAIVAAAMLAGPAVFYIFIHPTMAHASSLGLTALFLFLWWRCWEGEAKGLRSWLGLGLLFGLLIIVRYQNVVFGGFLLGLLWRQWRRGSLQMALRTAVALALAGLVPLSLQLAHLSTLHGSITGGDDWQSDEGLTLGRNPMDLSSPFFVDVLFSCQHGAITWAPVVGLGLLGLLWAARGSAWARWSILVVLVDVYLIGCLRGPPELMASLDAPPSADETHWSGGHAFGMRYLTEIAPLIALGLAAGFQRLKTDLGRRALSVVLTLLVFGNGLLLLAYGSGEISRVGCVTYGEMASGAGRALGRLLP